MSLETDEQVLQIAAELDSVTPDVMTLIDALVRQVNRRAAATVQMVEARLADQRQAIIAEYADAFRELRDELRALKAWRADQDARIDKLEDRLHILEDRIVALHYLLVRQQVRPQPSAEWRISFAPHCKRCGTWWQAAPVRFLGGVWWLDCPLCGEQQAC